MIKNNIKGVISLVLVLMLMAPLVSAGSPGILWTQESSLVPEKTTTCLTYGAYNPWEGDVFLQIKLSEELQEIVKTSESETKFVPELTFHDDALPIEFCFKTPNVYTRDCLVGNFICEQTCDEPMKTYEGQVEMILLSEEEAKISGGSGASASILSAAAPLRIRVQCVPSDRNYGIIYGLIALIAGILLWINIVSNKKPKKKAKKKLYLKK